MKNNIVKSASLKFDRNYFMKNTGVFVTPEYFDMILSDYEEYKQNDPVSFCKQWMQDHDGMTVETVSASDKM